MASTPRATPRATPLQSIGYRRGSETFTRCSRCHREQGESPLVDARGNSTGGSELDPIMIGTELIALVCDDCRGSIIRHVQAICPDGFAFPFVTEQRQLLPTPRCDCGAALSYSADGRSVLCHQCDADTLTDAVPA